MSKIAVIGGASATGKSTSYCKINDDDRNIHIEGLDPNKTFIINVAGKELPAIGMTAIYRKLNHLFISEDYLEIIKVIKSKVIPLIAKKEIENIVIEDAQYLMSFDFFNKRNIAGYDKYAKIGFSFLDLMKFLAVIKGVYVFILMHTEKNQEGEDIAMKTIGKMLDEKYTLEGLWTTVLIAEKKFNRARKQVEYTFRTRPAYEHDIAKSPIGMFKEAKIPNDLAIVRRALEKL